jgi:hypothetical protein
VNLKAFISYSSVDAKLARRVAKVLKTLGVEHFLDSKDVQWGDRITDAVRDGIASCTDLIVIVSPASVKSQWVLFEIGQASALGKRILMLLTHPAVEVPSFISQYHHKSRVADVEKHFQQLLNAAKGDEAKPDDHAGIDNVRDLLLAYAYRFANGNRRWFSMADIAMDYYNALRIFNREGTLTGSVEILMSHFPKKEDKESGSSQALDELAVEAALDGLVAEGLLERKRDTIFESAFEITEQGRAYFSGQVRPRLFQ